MVSNYFKHVIKAASAAIGFVFLSGCAPVIVAGTGSAAVGTTAGSNSVSVKTQLSDIQIKMRAVELLKDFPELKNNSNVEIVVFDRIVLLLGQVPTKEVQAQLADKIASIPGAEVVYNQLTVGPRVSVGTYASDSFITTSVISSLIANGINSLKYKVVTENGIVYMMGAVTRQEAKEASTVASKVSGVKRVIEAYSFKHYSENHNQVTENQMKQSTVQENKLSNHEINNNEELKPQITESDFNHESAIGPTGPV